MKRNYFRDKRNLGEKSGNDSNLHMTLANYDPTSSYQTIQTVVLQLNIETDGYNAIKLVSMTNAKY